MHRLNPLASLTAVGLSLLFATAANAQKPPVANEQFIPIASYRVGPYAAAGTSIFGGFIDYLNLVNIRDGGINGVTITWEECETSYTVDKGIPCYEKLKNHPPTGASMFTFYSTAITYAVL